MVGEEEGRGEREDGYALELEEEVEQNQKLGDRGEGDR